MEKGKCFSACNRGQRKKSDFYQTPFSITRQLLMYEYFDKYLSVIDPCDGTGAITNQLHNYFRNGVYGNDISYNADFLDWDNWAFDYQEEIMRLDYIITNPPFSLSFEFIQKSKEVAKNKFAMLLPLSYLHGQKRYNNKIFLDSKYPLVRVYVFTRYPLLSDNIRLDGKYNTGMIAYAWYIWEKNKSNLNPYIPIHPTIHWIDNQKYVLSKKDK